MMAKTMPARLLVVDQDARYGEWLKHHLGVLLPESTVSALHLSDFERWSQELSGRDCDVLMLAAPFGSSPEDPQAQGLELLRQLREKPHFPAVIAVAEDGNELTAVRALQLGAVDYLPKRLLTPERLKTSVRLALRMIEKRVARRIANLAKDPSARKSAIERNSAAEAGRAAASGRATDVERPADAKAIPDGEDRANTQAPADAGAGINAKGRPDAYDRANAQGSVDGEARAHAKGPSDGGGFADTRSGKASNEASTPLPAAKAPGGEFMAADFIPGYTIHATIGESEKAAVYVATSAARAENVALKVSKTLRDEAAGRQFLEREYTAIVAIRHPSVVQIHDYGIHAGYEYLVMEYLPRGDLKARMQQGLTEQEALRYVAQIAEALQVVHHAGLLHRDLKPPNVMLRENGDVALIDFGLARALDGSTASTRTGVLRGSPYYMSPEQALGEVLDARSDFYSLGIMYYEMLTGKKPYTGGSAMDVLQQHVNAPLPTLPKALTHHEPILLKLLAKSRQDRYATAAEVLMALAARRELIQSGGRESAPMQSSAA
ncbi:MAG: protein kinase domain-containing protein [Steroidobacteraceae bacterium]